MPEDVVTSGTENAGTAAPASSGAGSGSTGAPASAAAPVTARPSALASLEKVSAAASSAEGAIDPATGKPRASTAGATVQPGQPGANAGATEDAAWAAIPESRKNVILENARTKEREKIEGELGWARGVNREAVTAGAGFAARIHRDPVAFVTQLIGEIRQNPTLAARLDREFGGGEGGRGGNAVAASAANPFRTADGRFQLPKPKLMAEDGRTGAYSADQFTEALTAFEDHLTEKFGGRVAPLEQAHTAAAEREQVISIIHQSRQEATSLMTELRALPQWPKGGSGSEGERKIATYLGAIPAERKSKIGSTAAMYEAFNSYLQRDVFPTLQSNTSQQVRDDLRRKAASGTGSVTPGSAQPSQRAKGPTNVSELSAHLEWLAAAQA